MLLIETIKVQNKQLQNIAWHNQRINRTRLELFGIKESLLLENIIQIPNDLDNGIFKCRIIYSIEIEKIEFGKYIPRKIHSLKVLECNDINYSYKYYNRLNLDDLFQQKENCDDILIIKNGFVSDTSFANIVFWDGQHWLTPSTPLLKGTTRERLLRENKIQEAEITVDDLLNYDKARIINAMNDLDESGDILNFQT